MAGREFASYYRQPSLPRPATFAPRMPPNTSMRMVACSNPISSLPSQNSKFRDMTTFEPRMSFPTSTSTTPTLPLQPRLFHQANYNSMCYQNGYYWYQSLTEQRMVSTQYPSPGHTLPLETTSLRYPMQPYGMPLNIQPYPRPLPTLPIQDHRAYEAEKWHSNTTSWSLWWWSEEHYHLWGDRGTPKETTYSSSQSGAQS